MNKILIGFLTTSLLLTIGCDSDNTSSSNDPGTDNKITNIRKAELEEINSIENLINPNNSWLLISTFREGNCQGTVNLELLDMKDGWILVSYDVKGHAGTCASKKPLKKVYLTKDQVNFDFLTNSDETLQGTRNGKNVLTFKTTGNGKSQEVIITYADKTIIYPVVANLENKDYDSSSTINISPVKESTNLNLEGLKTEHLYFSDALDLINSMVFEFVD